MTVPRILSAKKVEYTWDHTQMTEYMAGNNRRFYESSPLRRHANLIYKLLNLELFVKKHCMIITSSFLLFPSVPCKPIRAREEVWFREITGPRMQHPVTTRHLRHYKSCPNAEGGNGASPDKGIKNVTLWWILLFLCLSALVGHIFITRYRRTIN